MAYYPPDMHLSQLIVAYGEQVAMATGSALFVIVEPKASKTLVSWGSAPVKAELELEAWPAIYRARTELQENAFKPMIDHGALNL
ncbi:hypothetical protein C2W62_53415, partial [Candidatus Entotheonella serta]